MDSEDLQVKAMFGALQIQSCAALRNPFSTD